MTKNKFSTWAMWQERSSLDDIRFPGVYVIALSDKKIAGKAFSWRREIIYVGMTNAKSGLKSRLQQFDNTIKGKDGHGGGRRVRYKHRNYKKLIPLLYVSVWPHECDVKSNRPADLRITSAVAKLEYECFAVFVEKFGRLPEFNDKEKSPKK